MTSQITQAGLTIDSKAQLLQDLIAAMQAIYGADINVNSNSPDGQYLNIQAQTIEDFLELLLNTYNNFALDTSYGERLDQLVALNGIQRQAGTNTLAQVDVVASQALNLPGLDQTAETPFTVSDNSGNQYFLKTSYVFASPGTQTLQFEAEQIGMVETVPNTIVNIVTATLGISSVNNPTIAGDSIGVNEETDAQLKIRHAQSLNLAATGPADAMESALRNIDGVVDAYVVENDTGSTVNGIPARSLWAIVRGGTPEEIAQAIYTKKGVGCGMFGSESYIVTRPNGQTFTAAWDYALAQSLYVKFAIIWTGTPTLDDEDIKIALAAALVYRLGQNPSIRDVLVAMNTIAPSAIITIDSSTQGVSDDDSIWASVVQPQDPQYYFTLDPADITIS